MQETECSVECVQALHEFVHHTLCESENLLSEQFHTEQKPLLAKDKLCGIEYSLRGLRSVRLGAIWAADQNVVYFYNAKGERYRKVRLTHRIAVELPVQT